MYTCTVMWGARTWYCVSVCSLNWAFQRLIVKVPVILLAIRRCGWTTRVLLLVEACAVEPREQCEHEARVRWHRGEHCLHARQTVHLLAACALLNSWAAVTCVQNLTLLRTHVQCNMHVNTEHRTQKSERTRPRRRPAPARSRSSASSFCSSS